MLMASLLLVAAGAVSKDAVRTSTLLFFLLLYQLNT